MKLFSYLSILYLISCSSQPHRNLASESIFLLGNFEKKNSKIETLINRNSSDAQFFYLELRNKDKVLIDIEIEDIKIAYKKHILPVEIERLSRGKYLLNINKPLSDYKFLTFSIQGETFAHQLKKMQTPDKKLSKINIISNQNHLAHFRLELKNSRGTSLEIMDTPELIPEGQGSLSELNYIEPGVWEFYFEYPEANQIFYFSVRANGVLLERIYRFQHIEK